MELAINIIQIILLVILLVWSVYMIITTIKDRKRAKKLDEEFMRSIKLQIEYTAKQIQQLEQEKEIIEKSLEKPAKRKAGRPKKNKKEGE